MKRLLTVNNAKTLKGAAAGYLTGILHLAPYTLAGVGNVCPYASAGCVTSCLNTAGRGGIGKANDALVATDAGLIKLNTIQKARIRRTRYLMTNRAGFLASLYADILRIQRQANRLRLKLAVRLNGTSDLRWHKIAPALFASFPEVQFYDYTKDAERVREYLRGELPPNYHLTFSRSESNEATAAALHREGASVALVVSREVFAMPNAWRGPFVTVNGDAHDLRFLDPKGALVILTAKGRAKHDQSGFVIR